MATKDTKKEYLIDGNKVDLDEECFSDGQNSVYSLAKKISKEVDFEHLSNFDYVLLILQKSLPATFSLLFIFIAETINIIFVGQTSNHDSIAGIGLGTLIMNATGYILCMGLLGGLDTLGAQAFGAGQLYLLGIHTHITRISVFLFFLIICCPCFYFSYDICIGIGQSHEISTLASSFVTHMIPSLFFAVQFNASVRYLQSQSYFTPGMYITMGTVCLHPIWCYLLVVVSGLDVIGAAYAMGCTQLLNLICISIYIHFWTPYPESYFWFNKDSIDFRRICDYLKLAVPSALLFAADWIGFEILTLMSSYLGALSLAANVCLFNFITMIFMIPMGISFSSTALVGIAIGAGNIPRAKKISLLALATGVCLLIVTTILVILFKYSIPYAYTTEDDVALIVTELLKIYTFFGILDGIQIILHGIIKGIGKQAVASIVCLVVLYPVNIPLAYVFAWPMGYGLYGLWYSQVCSIVLLNVSYLIILIFNDWHQISHLVREKMRKTKKEIKAA